MKIISNIIGVIAILGGIVFGFLAFIEPGNYQLVDASSIQIQQVYAQSGYYANLSIICLLLAIAILLSTSGNTEEQQKLAMIRHRELMEALKK